MTNSRFWRSTTSRSCWESVRRSGDFQVDLAQSSRQGLDWALSRDYDWCSPTSHAPEIGACASCATLRRPNRRAGGDLHRVCHVGLRGPGHEAGGGRLHRKALHPDMLLATVQKALEKAKTAAPEAQEVVHKQEVIRVLERAAVDSAFVSSLFYEGAGALEDYELTGPEKLAILTGDVQWLESQVGTLTAVQKALAGERLAAKIW